MPEPSGLARRDFPLSRGDTSIREPESESSQRGSKKDFDPFADKTAYEVLGVLHKLITEVYAERFDRKDYMIGTSIGGLDTSKESVFIALSEAVRRLTSNDREAQMGGFMRVKACSVQYKALSKKSSLDPEVPRECEKLFQSLDFKLRELTRNALEVELGRDGLRLMLDLSSRMKDVPGSSGKLLNTLIGIRSALDRPSLAEKSDGEVESYLRDAIDNLRQSDFYHDATSPQDRVLDEVLFERFVKGLMSIRKLSRGGS